MSAGSELDKAADETRQAAISKVELPDTFAAINDLLVDSEGNIWAREYVPLKLHDRQPPRWFVFDSVGHLRYAVRSPAALARSYGLRNALSARIGTDHILAADRDEDGVESVVVYSLGKK